MKWETLQRTLFKKFNLFLVSTPLKNLTLNLTLKKILNSGPNLTLKKILNRGPNLTLKKILNRWANLTLKKISNPGPNLTLTKILKLGPNLTLKKILNPGPNLTLQIIESSYSWSSHDSCRNKFCRQFLGLIKIFSRVETQSIKSVLKHKFTQNDWSEVSSEMVNLIILKYTSEISLYSATAYYTVPFVFDFKKKILFSTICLFIYHIVFWRQVSNI